MEPQKIEEILKLAADVGAPLAACDDLDLLARPVQAGDALIPNALAVHPMEGCDGAADGRPDALTFRRYQRFAAGGAGLLWVEAIAVVSEGRANPRQLWLNEKSKPAFARLIARTREAAAHACGADHRPMIVAQLTHSGRYSRPVDEPHPLIPQHDPSRDARMNLRADWPVLDDAYLDRLQDAYVHAARLAFDAGFDAVDIKSCHGYLMNELFASRRREGRYGGSFENRTRLLLAVVDRIHDELGADKRVTARLGVFDAIPDGWAVNRDDPLKPDLTEPKKLIRELRARGMRMINITVANPYYNPYYGRPFNAPVAGVCEAPEHPLVGASRLIQLAGDIQRQFPDVAVVGTGYSWLGVWMPYVAAATLKHGLATLVGCGRMAFAYPDFARDILEKGALDPEKVCIACSGCTQIMRDRGRTGCVVRDSEVYGPIFEAGRLNNRDNLARLAGRCGQCRNPSCIVGCPAGIRIPEFIRLFLDGKDREAYEVIRAANIFPEICARLCPVERQCEGHCLMDYVGDEAVPIAAIQRYLAWKANREGWSKLRIPDRATGKTVAVLGAGPAGLACAAVLLEAGHAVTVFDKDKTLGGMVESAIPEERQGTTLQDELAAVFSDAPADRLTFASGREFTPSFNLNSVLAQGFDAVFIGIGLPHAVTASPQKPLDGLWNALDFLRAARTEHGLDLTGRHVAVIGGGNTAMDAAMSARRLGARDVYVIYRRSFAQMPAWPAERDRALNSGIHFIILTQPIDYHEENGRLTGIRVCPTRLGEPDASGRRRPEPVDAAAYDMDVDVVIEAIGQAPPANLHALLPGVATANSLVRIEGDSARTSVDKVFAGGDLVRGAATIVHAVADGMKAGREIDRFLATP